MNKTVTTLLFSALAISTYKLMKLKEKHKDLAFRMNKTRDLLNDEEVYNIDCPHCELSGYIETAYLYTLPGFIKHMEEIKNAKPEDYVTITWDEVKQEYIEKKINLDDFAKPYSELDERLEEIKNTKPEDFFTLEEIGWDLNSKK
jgi:hypothetical protein